MRHIQLLLLVFFTHFVCGQDYPDFKDGKTRFLMHFGVGSSRLSGYGLLAEIGLNKNSNNLILRYNFNSQVGNIEPEHDFLELVRDRYNDRFMDVSVLYGRSFSYKRFSGRMSLGLAYCSYTDKYLYVPEPNPNSSSFVFGSNDYAVGSMKENGVGGIAQADLQFYFIPEFGMGLSFYWNINKLYYFHGGCLTILVVLNSK
jgi:hypothetical protein